VYYRSTKYKDLEFSDLPGEYDVKFDGLGTGLTFKF